MPDGGVSRGSLDISLHWKQGEAFKSCATELLYGGAAGGGKSHLMRCAAVLWCSEVCGLNVYIFRRVEDDLIKNHMEGPSGFRNMLAPWVQSGKAQILQTEIRFWNGSKIFLCHCKDEAHRYKYHGAEIHVLMVDELTTFTEIIYRYLRFRLRMVGIKTEQLPRHYRKGEIGLDGKTVNPNNMFPRILCSSNPGNIGHNWVKRTFLECDSPTIPRRTEDAEGGLIRQYVPARLEDNPSMERDDPTYRQRMRGLGDPALVRAMESGDWNVLAGGFFPEFTLEKHVLKSCTLPKEIFTRHNTCTDWGSARPSSTGWYAIADDDWKTTGTLGNQILVPRGALVRYREWYTKKAGEDNKGQKLSVETWATGVLQRSKEYPQRYGVVDTSMFDEDGGPSLAERAMKVELNGVKLQLRPSDKRRLPGWDQLRARLIGNGEYDESTGRVEVGDPMLFLMDNQPDAIRTIQSVQHDEDKPEDLNSDMEDHAVDEIRYQCMSRPMPKMRRQDKPRSGPAPYTFDWLIALDSKKNELRNRQTI